MNLTINENEPITYTNKYLKNTKNKKFSLALIDKKISEEEDKKDYELYKKSHMLHSAYSFEEAQKNRVSFPPATAPGIVRKTWREQLENATEEQKDAMSSFDNVYNMFLTENKFNMPNDLNGYKNLIAQLKIYMERYNNCPGVDKKVYENLINVANTLETEFEKY